MEQVGDVVSDEDADRTSCFFSGNDNLGSKREIYRKDTLPRL